MTLVLLHPLPFDASIWGPALRSLAASVVAPDLYDLGDSIEEWASGVFHGRPDRSGFLEALDVPVLVVSGEHDRTPSQGVALAARLRNGRFHRVEAAGHYVPLERPAELTAIVEHALREL